MKLLKIGNLNSVSVINIKELVSSLYIPDSYLPDNDQHNGLVEVDGLTKGKYIGRENWLFAVL